MPRVAALWSLNVSAVKGADDDEAGDTADCCTAMPEPKQVLRKLLLDNNFPRSVFLAHFTLLRLNKNLPRTVFLPRCALLQAETHVTSTAPCASCIASLDSAPTWECIEVPAVTEADATNAGGVADSCIAVSEPKQMLDKLPLVNLRELELEVAGMVSHRLRPMKKN